MNGASNLGGSGVHGAFDEEGREEVAGAVGGVHTGASEAPASSFVFTSNVDCSVHSGASEAGGVHSGASDAPASSFVYTSNVDCFFRRAGWAERQMVEIHGNLQRWQCSVPCGESLASAAPVWYVDPSIYLYVFLYVFLYLFLYLFLY